MKLTTRPRAVVATFAAVMIAITVTSCTDYQAKSLADRIGVRIPDNAIDISVDDPTFAIQGSCSSLEFSLPQSEWKTYVADYFPIDLLETLDSVPGFCGRSITDCRGGVSPDGFQASSDPRVVSRSIEIIPDCSDGQARIVWGTTD